MQLERLVTHIPPGRMTVESIVADAGGDRREARSFASLFGMESVACAPKSLGVADHLDLLLETLGPVDGSLQPQAFFYVHAQPARASDGLLAIQDLRARHPWLGALCFLQEVDQFNCASIFFALSAAARLLTQGFVNRVMVFAGDSLADWEPRHRYIPGCSLLGDAFIAMILSNRPGRLQFGPVGTRCYGEFAGGLNAGDEEMRQFHTRHLELVHDTLAMVDHPWDARRYILPHNINGLAWRLFLRRSGVKPDWVRTDLLRQIGHCCTTDPLLLLADLLRERSATTPLDATLMSIGMGGFTGAVRLSRAGLAAPMPRSQRVPDLVGRSDLPDDPRWPA